jgi:hypothetical protein
MVSVDETYAELVQLLAAGLDDPDGGDLRVELLYGGELGKDEALSSPGYWSGWITLPRPLAAGERHEYRCR